MNFEQQISNILGEELQEYPNKAECCAVGQGNYVYRVECTSKSMYSDAMKKKMLTKILFIDWKYKY